MLIRIYFYEGQSKREQEIKEMEMENQKKMEKEQLVPRQNMVSSSRMSTSSNSKPISSARDEQDLLVNTDWRILLNVGREPGTWMPKTVRFDAL